MAKHIIIDFKFDMKAFADTLQSVSDGDLSDFAAIIGIDDSTLRNWRIEGAKGKYAMPSMRNFINACNWLDLDPREFFVLDDDNAKHQCTLADVTRQHSTRFFRDGRIWIRRASICGVCGKEYAYSEHQSDIGDIPF